MHVYTIICVYIYIWVSPAVGDGDKRIITHYPNLPIYPHPTGCTEACRARRGQSDCAGAGAGAREPGGAFRVFVSCKSW